MYAYVSPWVSLWEPFYVSYDKIKPLNAINGKPSVYVWQAFPWLRALYTSFELNYSKTPAAQQWASRHLFAPLLLSIAYMCCLYIGPYLMSRRPAFQLKKPLAFWNLFLGVFSFCGMVRTVPYLLYFLSQEGYRNVNCLEPSYTHGDRDIGLWTKLFAASKAIELIDTLFIILRKKPLIFLHWYHHVTVLLFTTYACAFRHAGLFFISINYSVHAVMYSYFYFSASTGIPKWFNPMWITMAQITQMFIGIFVTMSTSYYKWQGDCPGAQTPLLIGSLSMYASYLFLFIQFAIRRFWPKPKTRKETKALSAPSAMPLTSRPLLLPPFMIIRSRLKDEIIMAGSAKGGLKEEVPVPTWMQQGGSQGTDSGGSVDETEGWSGSDDGDTSEGTVSKKAQ